MLKKIYDVNVFDDSSMKKMVNELIIYREKILNKFNELMAMYTGYGQAEVKARIISYDLNGTLGWLSSQVESTYDGSQKLGIIKISDSRAAFVEYGTGIQGSTHPHPEAFWIYDTNGHGDKGWWYPSKADDPNPYKKEINGKLYAWTKGMPSRPFMYDAGRYLYLYLDEFAEKVFGA